MSFKNNEFRATTLHYLVLISIIHARFNSRPCLNKKEGTIAPSLKIVE
jgi:hypothetical protein